jgi:hypothetical protein
MMPANTPDTNGAPEANATPKHNGSATRKTTKPAVRSRGSETDNGAFEFGMLGFSDVPNLLGISKPYSTPFHRTLQRA